MFTLVERQCGEEEAASIHECLTTWTRALVADTLPPPFARLLHSIAVTYMEHERERCRLLSIALLRQFSTPSDVTTIPLLCQREGDTCVALDYCSRWGIL